MSRWLRIWALLAATHFVGSLAVLRATASGFQGGQLLAVLLLVPAAEVVVLALVATLGGPQPRHSRG